MADPNSNDLLNRATAELKGIGTGGFGYPGTKPVLTGAAIGAVAGILLPVVTLPMGLVAGAGYALWRRIKR